MKGTPTGVVANVKAELARRGVLQSTVGDWLGLTQSAVSRRLVGEVEFTASELQTLARNLGVSIVLLYGDDAQAVPA